MKFKVVITTLFITLIMNVSAQDIFYKVSINDPQTRYATVEIEILNYKKSEIKFKMPVWTPGSYMVREFSRNVEAFIAYDENGFELPSDKENKNTWIIKNGKSSNLTIQYRVYANEVSVRTTFINNETAFLMGTSLLMFSPGLENLSGRIQIFKPDAWKMIATGLEEIADEPNRFLFSNYDELVDCPIQVGNFDTLKFDVLGVPHYVALVGHSNVQKQKLKKDLQKVCEVTANVVGKVDFKKYWFFVHHVDNGGGGLEHINSTAVVMQRWNYIDKSKYENFLSLCAHEYFHTWNVKRIRPIELGPFDYDKEVYTKQLWVAEGITSYYDELLMVRAGFWTKEKFLQDMASKISYSQNTPGAKNQSLALSSFDAWIKFYRPDENSVNSAVSYYTKGAVVAALLDLEIMSNSKGKRNMDDLMKHLYDEFYTKKKSGFTEAEFIAAAEKIAGKNLKDFFDKLVYGTESPDNLYANYFKQFGVEFLAEENKEPFLGVNVGFENGRTSIKSVLRNSNAFTKGLSSGDIIVSINGLKPTENFSLFLKNFDIDSEVEIIIERGGQTLTFSTLLVKNPYLKYSLKPMKEMSPNQKGNFVYWFGE